MLHFFEKLEGHGFGSFLNVNFNALVEQLED